MCQKISGSQIAADSYTITDALRNYKLFFACRFSFFITDLVRNSHSFNILSLPDIKYEIVKVPRCASFPTSPSKLLYNKIYTLYLYILGHYITSICHISIHQSTNPHSRAKTVR